MSEKKLFPAELRVLLLAGAVGVMVTAGGLAAMAALKIFRQKIFGDNGTV